VHTRSGGHVEVPDPPRGEVRDSVRVCRAPLSEGYVTSPDPFPSERRVRLVGVGRIVTGAVPSLSYPASQVPQCCHSNRDCGAVTGVSGWDPGHIHCGDGGPTPPVLGAVAEWLAFNAFVRRASERQGRLPLCREMASSEAEMCYSLEGRFATLERGRDVLPARG